MPGRTRTASGTAPALGPAAPPALAGVTAVIPVWGAYWEWVPALLDTLAHEGVPAERVIVVGNAEAPPPGVTLPPGVRLVVSPTRLGIGALRNLAIPEIRTPLVVFADADDTPLPGALGALAAALAADPAAVMATGRVQRSNGEPYPWPSPAAFRPQPPWARRLRQWGWNHLPMVTGTVLRTTALRAAGGFPDMRLAEDGALACALLCLGPAVLLDRPTRVYRVHPAGLCQRGHSPTRWRQAYAEQRRWLARHARVPLYMKALLPLYALVHRRLATRLAAAARHTT